MKKFNEFISDKSKSNIEDIIWNMLGLDKPNDPDILAKRRNMNLGKLPIKHANPEKMLANSGMLSDFVDDQKIEKLKMALSNLDQWTIADLVNMLTSGSGEAHYPSLSPKPLAYGQDLEDN